MATAVVDRVLVTLDDLETSALLRDFIENFISKLIQPSTGTRESGHLWCG